MAGIEFVLRGVEADPEIGVPLEMIEHPRLVLGIPLLIVSLILLIVGFAMSGAVTIFVGLIMLASSVAVMAGKKKSM